MQDRSIAELQDIALTLRKHIISMLHKAGSGHPGGSLSSVDYITALYFREMNVDPANPRWEDRDRFVLSKGHSCPALYAALAERGYFDVSVLDTLRKEGSILQGHPDMKKTPGIDISTGSLGQGFACAAGIALAGKRLGKDYRVFTVLGDGELAEGEIWEAAQICNKYHLDNCIVFADLNGLQIDGRTEDVMPLGDVAAKFRAFGFETWEIDGNDMQQIVETLDAIRERNNGVPKAILGHTIKGKGVSFMEDQAGWHGKAPNDEQYEQAMAELNGGAEK